MAAPAKYFADLQIERDQWKKANNRAVSLCLNLSNLLLQTPQVSGQEDGSLFDLNVISKLIISKLELQITQNHGYLCAIHHDMLNIYSNIRKIVQNIIEEYNNECNLNGRSLYLEQCVEFALEIQSMFEKEVFAKGFIVKALAQEKKRDLALIYISSLQSEPYLDDQRIKEIYDALQTYWN